LQLFEVGPWAGPLVGADGHRAVLATVVAPLRRLPPSGPLVWDAAGYAGWMRGAHAGGRTTEGLVALPAGRGPVWYWPAVVVLAGDLVTVVAVGAAWRRRHQDAVYDRGSHGTG
ncbi:MAG: hypothetical protein M3063_06770, partial [Actinomycetota bacterium]|nr:hypothetical protein [Actinomycetota bacterium]